MLANIFNFIAMVTMSAIITAINMVKDLAVSMYVASKASLGIAIPLASI